MEKTIIKYLLPVLLAAITVVPACSPALQSEPVDFSQTVNPVSASAASGQILIKRRPGVKPTNSLVPGLKNIRSIDELGIEVVTVPASNSLENVLAKLKSDPTIEYASPNFIRKAILPAQSKKTISLNRLKPVFGEDPLRKEQYGLDITQAEKGWNITRGKNSMIIAIIDTGIDIKHPDLAGKTVPGFSVIKRGDNTKDDNGHGTHCAGVAAAIVNNREGIAGMAPVSKLMPVKVLDSTGSGDDAGIIDGMLWAANHGADVISMSLGGPGESEVFAEAVKYVLKKNVVIVASMGNDGENSENYPAAFKGVIAVGSTDATDKISNFSNSGNWISVSAPGSRILSTMPTYKVKLNEQQGLSQNYAMLDGTSMATPYVAGLAALVLSKYNTLNPAGVKERIEKGADDLGLKGFDPQYGFGRINVYKTLEN